MMPVMLVIEDRIVEWLPWLTGANFMWGEKTPTSRGPFTEKKPSSSEYSSQARSTRKQGGLILFERSDNCRGFIIQKSNPCFRVLVAWDEY